MDASDINTLLEEWSKAKQQIIKLEGKIAKYKKATMRIMRKNGDNIVSGFNLVVTKRDITRSTICKDNVPPNIWEQYSKSTTYPVYYLRKNK